MQKMEDDAQDAKDLEQRRKERYLGDESSSSGKQKEDESGSFHTSQVESED